MISAIVGAFTFLTRVPIGPKADHEADPAASVPWFPLVGLAVGSAVGLVHYGLATPTGPPIAAAIAVTVGILITGGFHEDGLGDTADGFGVGGRPTNGWRS